MPTLYDPISDTLFVEIEKKPPKTFEDLVMNGYPNITLSFNHYGNIISVSIKYASTLKDSWEDFQGRSRLPTEILSAIDKWVGTSGSNGL